MNNNLKNEIEEMIKKLSMSHDDEESDNKVEETAEEYLKYIDSIRFIELITAIESKYDIEIDNKDLVRENTKELDTFVSMVGKYMK
ncbi:hypothetical protein [Clostridium beijerinckii]|mgnify:CR=1 FL=1|jgi:Phosphopantetheine attachment site.|uniref:Carrier domain-containing protein n=2 Tax=Clostridium beijerinckii TaxID=1520 RepID=A0AAE2RL92_CLOBE|nr:hypothetical protein [Clostridium beijerinckii]ABR32868.1 hypothetical protein Cbei_0682 [Clostridium beijerinckii NCIMB 8052]AIU04808.1 hypothetical protein Cbs_0682 [Clostridium beijerinckii ATCC 35702]MBF7807455.1 hypothetical protein [Clostridium beijerinckii]NOW88086.1 acyl carrier protein [Clostridium beijerinckii]NRT25892.1 acyl carrier protein [Clostridium beijerinckii]